MFTLTQILTMLIPTGAGVLFYWLNKPKQREEIESIVVANMKIALDEMRLEREDDRLRIKENKDEAARAREAARIAKEEAIIAQQQNDDCEFEHGITRMQLNKVLKKLQMERWVKSTVYVLDDNETVVKVFEHRFKTVPVVNFKSFVDHALCLKMAQEERPEIMVLDHMLSDNRTAVDIIKDLGYEPEIFIMSGNKDWEVLYKDTDVKFFYKDRFYIRNITKAIMEHLIIKNN